MSNIHMKLGNPFLIAIYSMALLLIGAAIGAKWGHNPHVALWLVVLGAAIMVAHDMLSYSVIFLVSTAWALRASRKREVEAASTSQAGVNAESSRYSKARERARAPRRN